MAAGDDLGRRRRNALAAALTLTILAAGCGGDPDGADSAGDIETVMTTVPAPAAGPSTAEPDLIDIHPACVSVIPNLEDVAEFLNEIAGKHLKAGTDTDADELRETFRAKAETVEEPLATDLAQIAYELGGIAGALDEKADTEIPLQPLIDRTKDAVATCAPYADSDGDGYSDADDQYPENALAWEPETITVVCDVKGGRMRFKIDRIEPDWGKVWRRNLPLERSVVGLGVYCESYGPKLTPVSDVEQELWDAERRPGRYTLRIPYEQCVEHGTPWTMNEWPVSAQQIPEARAALTLCPKHPDAAAIRARIGDQEQLEVDRQEGRAFSDGNFRVGKRIEPGTYYTTRVKNCYWERLDAAGNIIDNNFLPSALRVEVYISASDFSFHSDGCGEWRQIG